MRKADLQRNNLIYALYFIDKLTLSEISKKIDISVSQISRILSKNSKYQQEKDSRKEDNRKKHINQAKEIMKNKRIKKQTEEKAIMDKLHNEATLELSYSHPISKIAIRKNCSSAYKYNPNKRRFELKTDATYSKDMPLNIKY